MFSNRRAWILRPLTLLFAGLGVLAACTPAAPIVNSASPIVPVEASSLEPVMTQPISTVEYDLSPSTSTPQIIGPTQDQPIPIVKVEPTKQNRNIYRTQPGDTLVAVANRFGILPAEIQCLDPESDVCITHETEDGAQIANPFRVNPTGLIPSGEELILELPPGKLSPETWLIPDSAIVHAASEIGFEAGVFLDGTEGSLRDHRQYLMLNAWNSAGDIIQLVAIENSINPKLLLALLEYQCGCVLENPEFPPSLEPFLRAEEPPRKDLYGQLVWAVHQLSLGYYGWRAGSLTTVTLLDGVEIQVNPTLNAGTAALQVLFARLYGLEKWQEALDPETGFSALYREMFGNPWVDEILLFPGNPIQPTLSLPFELGTIWSYTGGPHQAYEGNGPLAALDFAPKSSAAGCLPSDAWVIAAADGLIVRSEFGVVIQDLDGDGFEQTGWNVLYLHLETRDRVPVGTFVNAGDPLGHPSCEGGRANGTHLHIARKFNGEWIPAGSGPFPFELSGWIAQDGEAIYKGTLHRGSDEIIACTCSWAAGWIIREE